MRGRPIIFFAVLLSAGAACAAPAGLERRTIPHGGRERTYRLYVPERGADDGSARPLVIALHGGGGDGKSFARVRRGGFHRLADRHGFLVAYPDAVEGHWNDGRGDRSRVSHREDVDDSAFSPR